MGKNQHIVPLKGKWGIIGEGNSKMTQIFETQKEAIIQGRESAINQQSELIIHNKEGRIREKSSYGNDPYPPKG